MGSQISTETESVVRQVMDAAFKVHRALGPGLLESVYELCLCHELARQGVPFERQLYLPVIYEGLQLDAGLRLDLVVAGVVVVELKAAERMLPLYEAQVLTYLKLSQLRLGLLINFNVPSLRRYFKT